MKPQPKLQRWTDLLAALLRHQRAGVTLRQLRAEVPGYFAATSEAAMLRTFERDKAELRAIGVPIESLLEADGSVSRYRLLSREFYLPWLHLAGEQAPPGKAPGEGYKSLERVGFEPDHLVALVRGVQRVTQLGDAALAHEARMALRRLAHDLPIDATLIAPELVLGEDALDAEVFDTLAGAVRRRKQVTFRYHSIRRDAHAERTVAPYGLTHLLGNWYLIAHDQAAGALRQFRLRRMRDVSANARSPGTPDFDVPADFDLWEHARSRQAWDLGDSDVEEIHVRFLATIGAVAAARKLGEPHASDPDARVFRVRRRNAFLRWILGMAGAATIIAPQPVVTAYGALITATRERYGQPPQP